MDVIVRAPQLGELREADTFTKNGRRFEKLIGIDVQIPGRQPQAALSTTGDLGHNSREPVHRHAALQCCSRSLLL